MRSRMAPDMEGRCKRCCLRLRYCGCAGVVPVPTQTRVVVIRHAHEAFKSTNSVRWAALALPNLEVHGYTGRGALDPRVLGTAEDTWLLFPGDEGRPLPQGRPARLLVLDGTWRQVRRMYRALPLLHALPRLSLTGVPAEGPRLRNRMLEGQLSTLEAIASALERLEGADKAAALRSLHARMVEGTQRGRGTFRPARPEDHTGIAGGGSSTTPLPNHRTSGSASGGSSS